jgi:hypothetical protein
MNSARRVPCDQRRAGPVRRTLHRVLALVILTFMVSCGGDSPVRPGPLAPPAPPPPPPPNQVPVIESITVGAERAEADSEVAVTASVRDAETAVEQLRLEWSAPAGTFTGSGVSVRWRAPKGPATPADYTLTLTVTETYGTGQQHVVSRTSSAVRVHDSPQELSALAMDFLRDFSDSRVSAEDAVRHFADTCAGKQAELEDVRKNREHYQIVQSRYSVQSVSVDAQRTRGEVRASCEFTSRVVKCHPEIANCAVGMTVPVQGVCAMEGRYEQRRWWLCESRFVNPTLQMRGFFFGR